MRKIMIFLAVMTGMSFTIASCDLEASNNGDLDGFWQMTDVDTLATGGHVDMRPKAKTWGFQGKILQIRDAGGYGGPIYSFKFSHSDDKLVIYEPYKVDRTVDDVVIDSVDLLRSYGINALREEYDVLKLNSDRMVLRSSMLQLTFRKY